MDLRFFGGLVQNTWGISFGRRGPEQCVASRRACQRGVADAAPDARCEARASKAYKVVTAKCNLIPHRPLQAPSGHETAASRKGRTSFHKQTAISRPSKLSGCENNVRSSHEQIWMPDRGLGYRLGTERI